MYQMQATFSRSASDGPREAGEVALELALVEQVAEAPPAMDAGLLLRAEPHAEPEPVGGLGQEGEESVCSAPRRVRSSFVARRPSGACGAR